MFVECVPIKSIWDYLSSSRNHYAVTTGYALVTGSHYACPGIVCRTLGSCASNSDFHGRYTCKKFRMVTLEPREPNY